MCVVVQGQPYRPEGGGEVLDPVSGRVLLGEVEGVAVAVQYDRGDQFERRHPSRRESEEFEGLRHQGKWERPVA